MSPDTGVDERAGRIRRYVGWGNGREGEEHTWLGRGADLDTDRGELSPHLVAQLRGGQYVEILDPRWGRNDLLWATLDLELGSVLAECRDG